LFSGSPIKRIGVTRLIRNCLIAAGNSGDPDLVPSVRAHLGDPDPVIAEAAEWALGRLGYSSEAMQAA
jgi:epoxyqueuosine reductase